MMGKQLAQKNHIPDSISPISRILGQFYINWNVLDSALFYSQKAYQQDLKTNIRPVPLMGIIYSLGRYIIKKSNPTWPCSISVEQLRVRSANRMGKRIRG
jgi:hypothetical protein